MNVHVERRLLPAHREYLARDLTGRVLEIGCGTGAMFPYFAAADDGGVTVHAVEPDPHMRRRTRTAAARRGMDLEMVAGVVESLPYLDGAFDVVVSANVFCSVLDVETALSEVRRVLAPAGIFAFSTTSGIPDYSAASRTP